MAFILPKRESTMVRQLRQLKKLSESSPEAAHKQADVLLTDFLRSIGYYKICAAYERVPKYYSWGQNEKA